MVEDFKRYSGINSGFQIKQSFFKDNQSRLDLNLSETEKNKLLQRFHFLSYDSFLIEYHNPNKKPRVYYTLYDFYRPNNSYIYYVNDGDVIFEYFVICLSKETNSMIFCENFRE